MATQDITTEQLGIDRPPLDDYRKTLFVLLLTLVGLLLVAFTSNAEEVEGPPSYGLAALVIGLLVVTFAYETVIIIDSQVASTLQEVIICSHCQALNPYDEAIPEPLACEKCDRQLAVVLGLARVNYGPILTGFGFPILFARLGLTKLEYEAKLGQAPQTVVTGDLIEGDKIAIKDSVLHDSTIGSSSPRQVSTSDSDSTNNNESERE